MGRSLEVRVRAAPVHRPARSELFRRAFLSARGHLSDPRAAEISRRVEASRQRHMQYLRGGRWS